MYVIITYLVWAALIAAIGIALFIATTLMVAIEAGTQAIAKSIRLHAHALTHAHLQPQASPSRREMHA